MKALKMLSIVAATSAATASASPWATARVSTSVISAVRRRPSSVSDETVRLIRSVFCGESIGAYRASSRVHTAPCRRLEPRK
jgi:hypothetical protein